MFLLNLTDDKSNILAGKISNFPSKEMISHA
jgi:hypothetical protein